VPLCDMAAKAGLGVVLLGSTSEALERAGAVLRAEIPGLRIARQISPVMGFDPEGGEAKRLLADIKALGPGLCLLALAAPKQETFAALGRQLAPQIGFASIGAGLDFLFGHQTRAPALVRALALEWAWWALSSPRRLIPRYADCAVILPSQTFAAFDLWGKN
jgi:N-acetylglucosaminyldiphosphoundecaprenol N-acetyl-beta-D-mannosaminyltransferase